LGPFGPIGWLRPDDVLDRCRLLTDILLARRAATVWLNCGRMSNCDHQGATECSKRFVCPVVLAALSLAPAAAFAQASIAGVVKDASGAVLPGVSVEASSPVMIEKVRSAETDGGGADRIVDLRAGNVGVDIYNLFNRSPILTYNQSFVLPSAANPNGNWLTPTSVLQPRFVKISAQIDF
jgi:hypothetical protein